jgi:hypothetical protein
MGRVPVHMALISTERESWEAVVGLQDVTFEIMT